MSMTLGSDYTPSGGEEQLLGDNPYKNKLTVDRKPSLDSSSENVFPTTMPKGTSVGTPHEFFSALSILSGLSLVAVQLLTVVVFSGTMAISFLVWGVYGIVGLSIAVILFIVGSLERALIYIPSDKRQDVVK